jgi:hypothetical protein
MWSCATLEKFIMHVLQALAAITAKALQETMINLFGPRRRAQKNLRK